MRLPTYEYIADLIETDVTPPFQRVTRSGIRKFLMRAAVLKPLCPPSSPAWMKLWRQIEWSLGMARALRIEIPAHLWAEDKARLAAKLASPDFTFDDPAERERALRWTRRR